jgi:hypothetical protein
MLTLSTLPGLADQPASYSMASGSSAGLNNSDSDAKDAEGSSQLLLRPPGFSIYLNGILRGVLRMGSVRDTLDYNDTEIQVRWAVAALCDPRTVMGVRISPRCYEWAASAGCQHQPAAQLKCRMHHSRTALSLHLHTLQAYQSHSCGVPSLAPHSWGVPVILSLHNPCHDGACRSQAAAPSMPQDPSRSVAGLT